MVEIPDKRAFPTPLSRSVLGIPDNLVRRLIDDINTNQNNFRLSDEDLVIIFENLKLELHDLNHDGFVNTSFMWTIINGAALAAIVIIGYIKNGTGVMSCC